MSKIVRDVLLEKSYSGSYFSVMPMPCDGNEIVYQITLIEDCEQLRSRIKTRLDFEMPGIRYDFVGPQKADRAVR